jgi:EAL domain-containing protein (putative c-di-GMP-specific phosphodiesterase class I)
MNKTAKVLGRCARCETLPCVVQGTGRLYLWLPMGHSLNKLIDYLQASRFEHQLLEDEQCLVIDLKENEIADTAIKLEAVLTSKELQDTRILFMGGVKEPQLCDFSRVTKLSEFVNLSQSGWLLKMLADERFTNHFQPIVYAEDTSQIFAQEALLRGIDENGSLIAPSPMFSVAREANLLFQLDRAARLTAIREAVRVKLTNRIFINFTPTAIYDPAFCLRSTVSAVKQAGIAHENVVFEVTESERAEDIHHLKNILRFYRDAGFLIALDDLGAGYSSLNLIHQLRPDFIKLDMDLVRNVHQDPYKAVITEKILDIAQSLNIKTIAEGVECQEELRWLRTHNATFVQGYLIAKPVAQPVMATPRL